MLRQLKRARPWNTSGYICRACRCQQSLGQSQRARRESSYAPSQLDNPLDDGVDSAFPSAEDVEDSWLSNFNSLGAGLGQPENTKNEVPETLEWGKVGSGRTRRERLARRHGQSSRQQPAKREISGLDGLIAKLEQPVAASENATQDNSSASSNVGSAENPGTFKPVEDVEDVLAPQYSGIAVASSGDAHEKGQRPGSGPTDATEAMRAKFEEIVKRLEREIASKGEVRLHEVKLDASKSDHRTASNGPEESTTQQREFNASNSFIRKYNPTSNLNPPSSDHPTPNSESGEATMHQTESNDSGSLVRKYGLAPDLAKSSPQTSKARALWKHLISWRNGTGSIPSEPDSAVATSPRRPAASTPSVFRRTTSGLPVPKLAASEATEGKSALKGTAASSKIPPFGVSPREPISPGEDGSKPIIPGFITPTYKGQAESGPAAQALSKLHSFGWQASLSASEQELSKSKPSKEKPSKKPDASRTPKSIEKGKPATKSRRRDRISRVTSTSKAKASRASSASKSTRTGGAVEKSASGQRKTSQSASFVGDADAGPALPPNFASIEAKELEMTPLDIPQPPVPALQYGLDRVLFNPGVYQLQDPHSRVYNFDPYLQNIMPVVEFDYNALKEYKTSSQDVALAELAKEHGKRYIGSTSSMTGTLGHFHYLLSAFRPVNLDMLSRGFPDKLDTFTAINRAPNAIFLRWKNGTYAIDADKEYDGANVLMMLGKSMEKLLTVPTDEYERYRKSDPRAVPDEERSAPESFHYTTLGDFLMRSQLDAYDPRLPGTGMFDLKTRAVLTVRMNTDDFEPMTGYQIHTLQGRFESYEREYYDMIRSTMLKYMLQVRMGRMDGIFIAFHNVERIFGFQYVSLQDLDRALHGQMNTCLGNQEFKLSLEMLNKVLDMATKKFPEQSLRLHFEAKNEVLATGANTTVMWVYAEPMAENDIERIQATPKAKIAEFERTMLGMDKKDRSTPSEAAAPEIERASQDEAEKSDVAAASFHESDIEAAAQSTTASGDTPSPNDLGQTNPDGSESSNEVAPLFIANILVQSSVNDTVVIRPEKLKTHDNWKVEYIIQEWPASKQMWARYAQTKATRKEALQKLDEDDDTEAEDGKESRKAKKEKSYIAFMKSMSQRGREFRDKVEQMEAGREPVVYGRPLSEQRLSLERIDGVEDYMGWLYRRR